MDMISAIDLERCSAVEVGPGCYRRDIAETEDVRIWAVDMRPGSEWPYVDMHDALGEHVFVIEGELIEGERRFPAGSYLQYGPHSSHRPRSEKGTTLLGFNLIRRGGR